MPVALRIFAIMLLRAGPQHLPYSASLCAILVVFYIASGVLVLTTTLDAGQAIANMLLDAVLLFAFSYICLALLDYMAQLAQKNDEKRSVKRKYKARLVQMVSALAGIGVVYHLLAWPLFVQIHAVQADEQSAKIFALLMLLLISWQVLVFAHVFRHAMQMSMGRALALSFGYLFLSMAVAELIFPGS